MDRTLHLPIYGPIPFEGERSLAWDLFQTDAAARLRDVSLSSVPAEFSPHGMPASRFQHSAAVSHLAYLLSAHLGLSQQEQNVLVSAAILHDSGSPPFSHIAEVFMDHVTGNHHEAEALTVLQEDRSVKDVLMRYEVEPEEVIQTITGKHPKLGVLLAGTIDLDNIDNSLHLLHSLTGINPLPYRPEDLLKAFCFIDEQVHLDSDYLAQVLAWEATREQLYQVLYQPVHLSAASSLYRAMELAFQAGDLGPEFFRLAEGPALEYLKVCNPGSREIIHALSTWHHYPQTVRMENQVVDNAFADLAGDWKARMEVANYIAADLDLQPHQVSLYVGVDRGPRKITLPWSGSRGLAAAELFIDHQAKGRIALFCEGKKNKSFIEVAKASLAQRLAESKPESGGYLFF